MCTAYMSMFHLLRAPPRPLIDYIALVVFLVDIHGPRPPQDSLPVHSVLSRTLCIVQIMLGAPVA